MAKQFPVKSRRKILNPVFHLQTKNEENSVLTTGMIKAVRKSGQLNLAGRSLANVPERMFTMYELSEEDTRVNIDFNKPDDGEDPWWIFKPLTYIDLSSNVLQELPAEIGMFEDLTVLNLQDNNLASLPPEIGKLTKLIKVNLNRNKLVELPEEFFQLSELESLTLANNSLEKISKTIGDLVMLRELDLSNNQLTKLPPGLGYLVRLNDLNLSHNKLTKLPPDIVNLRVLTKLDVTHNDLKSLPKMGEMRKLQFLYAQHNDIEELPDFDGCEKIEQIYLGNNFIKEVTKEFCENVPHLKILDLRDNKVAALADEIAMLRQLIRLDLTNNELTELPNSMGLLPHLQNLQLEGNKLKGIRSDIIKGGTIRILKFLREKLDSEELANLNVSDVPLACEPKVYPDKYTMRNTRILSVTMKDVTTVPDEVFEDAKFGEVTVVDLCRNKLTEIPKGLAIVADHITELILSSNQIREVPDFICQCNNLKYFDLGKNQLMTLPDSLSCMIGLRELVLSNNRFTDIPECVYGMTGLEILLASDNKINRIEVDKLMNLKRLATLDLSNNNINSVPPELGNMKHLRSLELKGNSFRQPRYAILEQGTESLLSYLRDRIRRD